MKDIIKFLLANDMISGEKMDLDNKVLITNTKLRTMVCKELVQKAKDTDFVILEEGNEESIIWGTLVSLMIRKPSLLKVDNVYRQVNVPEIHNNMTSVTNGFPGSFKRATGFCPAEKNLDFIFAVIAAEIFGKKFCRTQEFGVIKMETKTTGNSTCSFKEAHLENWGMNISEFLEPRPEWLSRDKSVLLGVDLTNNFVERIRSNMLVIKPLFITGDDPNAVFPKSELIKVSNHLENPISYAD